MKAGDSIDDTITYLEMTQPPAVPPPPPPVAAVALTRAQTPTASYFLHLYGAVGAEYEWTDMLKASPGKLTNFLRDPRVSLVTLTLDGRLGGFYVLDGRETGVCNLAWFGLMPELVGRGFGRWFLGTAIRAAWDEENTERMTVNTCTLDHPRALPLYTRMGFRPIRRESRRRILTRNRIVRREGDRLHRASPF